MKKLITTLLFVVIGASAMMAQKTYPTVSIEKLQYVPDTSLAKGNDGSSYLNDTITMEGIVMFNPCWYGLSAARAGTFLADSINGRWHAIHVLCDPTVLSGGLSLHKLDSASKFFDNLQVGNKVRLVGIVNQFQRNHQVCVLPIQTTLLGIKSVPAPVKVQIDSFELTVSGSNVLQLKSGQPYEGSLVEFDSVTVTGASASGKRFYWNVKDNNGNTIPIRDLSGNLRNDTLDNYCNKHANSGTNFNILPKQNSTIKFLRGFIVGYQASGNQTFAIAPRDTNDIGPVIASAPIITNVVRSTPIPTTKQTEKITATITSLTNTVSSATLHYAQGLSTTTFTAVSMTSGSGNTWSATIPAVTPDSSYVRYWISAVDNVSNRSVFPADTTHSYLVYLVRDSGINSIKSITYTPLKDGYSLLVGDTLKGINVTGIVMCNTDLNDLGRVIIQSSNQPWCGLWLNTGTNITSLKRGDKIKVTGGVVASTSGMTNMNNVVYTLISHGNTLPASVLGLNIDSARTGSYNQASAYRNELVEFDTIYVASQNPDAPGNNFGEWEIAKSSSATVGLRCDDLSPDILPKPAGVTVGFNVDSLKPAQKLIFIKGIMDYANSEWKITPRNLSDISGYHAHTIGVREITNINNIVTKVYPNPAHSNINWEFNTPKGIEATVTLFDLSGRAVLQQPIHITQGHSTYMLELPALSNGIYMAQIAMSTQVVYAGKVVVLQ